MTAEEIWPLFGLQVRTPRLALRPPRDPEVAVLATVAAAGIHEPGRCPFSIPWTQEPSPELERGVFRWHWKCRTEAQPDDWRLPLGVFVDGQPIGQQDLTAIAFAQRRWISSGSWLGRPWQGQGLGKEMRAAMLHLAFEGLGAQYAASTAREDNAASIAVSQALGYEDNGLEVTVIEGETVKLRAFVLTRERWLERRRDDIEVEGLEACRELLGAPPA
ncbi:MAG TPA: GNAT family protein [Solirubrobacteraceae bacterium]|nr:GNAT family protein [Solirubrobacteraceae bacterium]